MKRFLIWFFTILGLIALTVLVLLVGPMIGLGLVWQIVIVAAFWLVAFLVWFIRWMIRRSQAKKLEEEVAAAADDTPVLREKMEDALETLKQSSKRGGSAFLYDLPWYIIIGPPGSGKTTALVESGLKFHIEGSGGAQAVAGVGGTRHCDWWFTEDAVLIDTAGRYTTQDSDTEVDAKSWVGFLDMLSRNRPRQPINGAVVCISIEDVMRLPPAEQDAHANAIRRRLDELHKRLKVAFPVYVVFTKLDLVAGFMEFFGDLSDKQAEMVWGATFKPKKKTDNMVSQFGAEYDELMRSLSEQVTDRLQYMSDARARSRIFAFPTQMASLKEPIDDFLVKIFEPSRYRVDVALRGVYFTSGTQEGNPIDRVLSAISRNFGTQGGMVPIFSGQGRSFFVKDMLQKVVFHEAGWVSTNLAHIRRMLILKTASYVLLFLAVVGIGGAWVWSYLENDKLINRSEAAMQDYRQLAAAQLSEAEVGDSDLHTVLAPLEKLRTMPLGYSTRDEDIPLTQRFGLGQHNRMRTANISAYRDSLERLLLPRLIWRVEDMINRNIDKPAFIYEALKVYLMLGGQEAMEKDFVRAWMKRDWERLLYPGVQNAKGRERLLEHLEVIIDRPSSAVPLNGALVDEVQKILVRMPIADRVYALLKTRAETAGHSPWIASERAGNDAAVVFETHDGAPLNEVRIPGFFTKEGFIKGFLGQLEPVIKEVKEEKWVLGEPGKQATFEAQYKTLREDVMTRYRAEFINHWDQQLARLKITPVGGTNLTVMSALAAPTSPLKQLMVSIRAETELTKLPEPDGAGADAAGEAGERAAKSEAAMQIRKGATNAAGRIGAAIAIGALDDVNLGPAEGDVVPNYGERIEGHFKSLHNFAGEAANKAAPVDELVAQFNNLYQAMNDLSAGGQIRGAAIRKISTELRAMDAAAPRLPGLIASMVEQPKKTIKEMVIGSEKTDLNKALANEVTRICEQIVRAAYPFDSRATKEVGLQDFTRLFGTGGIMDGFFTKHLERMVDQSGENWRWSGDDELSRNLSNAALREFQRARSIRDAFFASGALGIQFTITPVTLSPDALSVIFEADGQKLEYDHRAPRPTPMTWPGPAPGLVQISFAPEVPGQRSLVTRTGMWALVKLMRRNAGLGRAGKMSVGFSVGGRRATFTVQVQLRENPFKLKALSQFKCPRGF